MNLKKYLEVYGISQTDAAKALGVHRKYFWRVVNGKISPGRKLAEKIIAFTDGEVRSDDLPGWEDFR